MTNTANLNTFAAKIWNMFMLSFSKWTCPVICLAVLLSMEICKCVMILFSNIMKWATWASKGCVKSVYSIYLSCLGIIMLPCFAEHSIWLISSRSLSLWVRINFNFFKWRKCKNAYIFYGCNKFSHLAALFSKNYSKVGVNLSLKLSLEKSKNWKSLNLHLNLILKCKISCKTIKPTSVGFGHYKNCFFLEPKAEGKPACSANQTEIVLYLPCILWMSVCSSAVYNVGKDTGSLSQILGTDLLVRIIKSIYCYTVYSLFIFSNMFYFLFSFILYLFL